MADSLLLVGYGQMNRLVADVAPLHGFEVVGIVRGRDNTGGRALENDRWRGVSVAVDFSTAEAVVENLPRLAALGISVVVGTTGWSDAAEQLRRAVEAAGIGAVVAPNFSLGPACSRW